MGGTIADLFKGVSLVMLLNISFFTASNVTNALSTMLRLLGEELEEASWLI